MDQVLVQRTDDLQHTCILPTNIFQRLKLKKNRTYDVFFGLSHCRFHFDADDQEDEKMAIPTSGFKTLHLKSHLRLNIWKENYAIFLGPVIGIFVNERYFPKLKKHTLGARKYTQANEIAACMIYFFSHRNIDWERNLIKAYYYQPSSKKWIKRWFPFPNVLYDRCCGYGRRKENQKIHPVRQAFSGLRRVQTINNGKLNKWRVYRKLSRCQDIKPHLPHTILYKKSEDLFNMLNRHRYVFIKSTEGSGGRDVCSVEKRQKAFRVVFHEKGIQEKMFGDSASLKTFIHQFTQGKSFVIQSGLRLMSYKGRPFDLRILLVKDNRGKWRCVYNQARIARKKSTITSYALGGTLKNYKDMIQYLRQHHQRVPSNEQLLKQAVTIARRIEKKMGAYGEIGMDMAVDQQGKIWFLEGNSKPTKNPERGLEDTKGISPQFLWILLYARYLAVKESKQ